MAPLRSILPRTLRPTTATATARRFPGRAFTLSSRPAYKKEDLMDKDAVSPTSNEYSKSGGDQEAAAEDVAFDPSKTSPETQTESASQKNGGDSNNTLNVSPGNTKIAGQGQQQGRDLNETEEVGSSPAQEKGQRGSGVKLGGPQKGASR